MREFPIQTDRGYTKPHPTRIPWAVAELAYAMYAARYGNQQTLDRIAERGGFGPGEMDMLLPGWVERCTDFATLAAERDALRVALTEVRVIASAGERYHKKPFDETPCALRYRAIVVRVDAALGVVHA